MPIFGNQAAFTDLLARAAALPLGIVRTGLEELAERVRPIERPLAPTEVACSMGLATRDLGARSWCVGWSALPPITIEFTGDVEDIPADAYDLSDAWISPWGAVFCEGRLFVDDFRCGPHEWRKNGWMFWPQERVGFVGFDPVADTCVFDTTFDTVETGEDDPCFLFDTNDGAINFGHFVHDTLAQLLVYDAVSERLGRRPRPILFRGFQYPAQTALFEQLVGPLSNAIILDGRAIRCKSCFSSSRALRGWEGLVSAAAFRYLREKMLAISGGSAAGSTDLYISRGDAWKVDARSFENLDELEVLVRGLGFDEVVIGRLAPEEIIRRFGQARTIVGAHGAGLLNAMLAPRDVHVIELWAYPFSWRSIAMVCAASGIRHHTVRALEPTGSPYSRLDIPAIRALLRER